MHKVKRARYAGRPRVKPAPEPRPFLLCVDPCARVDAKGRPLWAVKVGTAWLGPRWRFASDVVVQVTMEAAVFHQPGGRPIGYLRGSGIVRVLERGRILITA